MARRVMKADRSMKPAPPAQSFSWRRERSEVKSDVKLLKEEEGWEEEELILVSSAIFLDCEDARSAAVNSRLDW
jgi:hypothetical protein